MIYEIDGSQMQDLKQAHCYLKSVLKFPDYYG
ncbi:MAG: barstar family protein, partial [Oscillospiraceae bacterium]|nr:barstar family protein [Oscillospiraceae bacterium]